MRLNPASIVAKFPYSCALVACAAPREDYSDRKISGLLRPPDHPKDVESRKFRLSVKSRSVAAESLCWNGYYANSRVIAIAIIIKHFNGTVARTPNHSKKSANKLSDGWLL